MLEGNYMFYILVWFANIVEYYY